MDELGFGFLGNGAERCYDRTDPPAAAADGHATATPAPATTHATESAAAVDRPAATPADGDTAAVPTAYALTTVSVAGRNFIHRAATAAIKQ